MQLCSQLKWEDNNLQLKFTRSHQAVTNFWIATNRKLAFQQNSNQNWVREMEASTCQSRRREKRRGFSQKRRTKAPAKIRRASKLRPRRRRRTEGRAPVWACGFRCRRGSPNALSDLTYLSSIASWRSYPTLISRQPASSWPPPPPAQPPPPQSSIDHPKIPFPGVQGPRLLPSFGVSEFDCVVRVRLRCRVAAAESMRLS